MQYHALRRGGRPRPPGGAKLRFFVSKKPLSSCARLGERGRPPLRGLWWRVSRGNGLSYHLSAWLTIQRWF